ncbi:MAG TPA: uroporphyrinogen-III C-methyltransferase, partial [Gammaproteobacteria bacterium]|nr:uroporphyrinogen-III C-methyltransferase [Gammaproteobacteria bacterium]
KNHKTDAHSEVANPMVATAPAPRSHRLFWLAVIGFSGLMIAALVGAYILHQTIQLSLSTASQQLQNTQEQVAQLQERFANMQQTLQSQQDTLDQQTKLTSDLQFKNLNNVLVAQHWVQLANNYFLLTANIPHAINFLGQALNELDKVSDPQSIVLKQALQNDLATLRNIPWVNPYDVYNRVTRLQQQVLQLPLLQVPTQDKASNLLPPLENASSSFWRQSVQTAWDALRQMIVVHHLPNANTPPFIMPDQRPYIYQNLYVLLNETLWAVLNEDVDIYHASLKRVSDWINQYFDLSAPAVTSVLGELAQLQSITLQPAKGVMLTSPKAFQDYLKNS